MSERLVRPHTTPTPPLGSPTAHCVKMVNGSACGSKHGLRRFNPGWLCTAHYLSEPANPPRLDCWWDAQ